MTTIQVNKRLLGQIKIYCAAKRIKQGSFVERICKRDKEFSRFVYKFIKL